jgi:hypothetical protein
MATDAATARHRWPRRAPRAHCREHAHTPPLVPHRVEVGVASRIGPRHVQLADVRLVDLGRRDEARTLGPAGVIAPLTWCRRLCLLFGRRTRRHTDGDGHTRDGHSLHTAPASHEGLPCLTDINTVSFPTRCSHESSGPPRHCRLSPGGSGPGVPSPEPSRHVTGGSNARQCIAHACVVCCGVSPTRGTWPSARRYWPCMGAMCTA